MLPILNDFQSLYKYFFVEKNKLIRIFLVELKNRLDKNDNF